MSIMEVIGHDVPIYYPNVGKRFIIHTDTIKYSSVYYSMKHESFIAFYSHK